MSVALAGTASVRASHPLSRTPSVTRTRLRIRSAFAASGIDAGLRITAATSQAPPAARASARTPSTARVTPTRTRRRPSRDIARGRTCWGISLQVRVSGRASVSLLMNGEWRHLLGNAQSRA